MLSLSLLWWKSIVHCYYLKMITILLSFTMIVYILRPITQWSEDDNDTAVIYNVYIPRPITQWSEDDNDTAVIYNVYIPRPITQWDLHYLQEHLHLGTVHFEYHKQGNTTLRHPKVTMQILQLMSWTIWSIQKLKLEALAHSVHTFLNSSGHLLLLNPINTYTAHQR